jgi:lipoprotein-releasing system ATP-binding protein
MNNPQPIQPLPLERDILLKAEGIGKTFTQGGKTLNVLHNLDMKLEAGEIVALVGPSGSGKSTLLQILGLLDKPSTGHLRIGDRAAEKLNDIERTKLRRTHIGFVYQFHHLLPEFTAQENVALPQIIAGVKRSEANAKAAQRLEELGLGARLDHRPARLSGGEQQRVAIARALANDPKLLFADEPTGNLDPTTSAEVFDILLGQVRERGIGALIATHNMDLADQMDRILELKNGRVLAL